MATIKTYTDIEQSKKLAEFLPIESADMFYWCADHYPKEDWIIEVGELDDNYECICAWSLAALLGVLPNSTDICKNIEGRYYVHGFFSDNPVDACVDAIKALHELNLL